jgi:PilZ domain
MTYQKVRRSGRFTIAVPILLIGSDSEGRVFSEETKTVIISLHGAGFLSPHKLVAD